MAKDEAFDRKLAELRTEFTRMLPPKIKEIKDLWLAIDPKAPKGEKASSLFRITHSLAGSGTVFGFPEVTRVAVRLEKIFSEMARGNPCPPEELPNVKQLMAELEQLQGDGETTPKAPESSTITVAPSAPTGSATRNVFLLAGNPRFVESFKIQMEAYQYKVVPFQRVEVMLSTATKQRPAFIMVDLAFLNAFQEGVKSHAGLLESTPVFFTGEEQESFALLLQVVRAGGAGFFPRPVNLGVLMDKLEHLVIDPEMEPFRVLICDDDEAFAKHAAFILQKAGMQAVALSNPAEVLSEIERLQPDLLLIDLYMPDCNGFELGRVIRMKEEHVGLPIIYLSVENQIQKHIEALQMGGDDFMLKPIRFNHLYKAVTARIKRARQIRSYISLDGLTGLLNHSSFIRRLKDEFGRAEKQTRPLGLAVLDLDQFTKVNNTHGHAMGDQVLRTMARFVADRTRQGDIVGRFGGDQLGVIMPNSGVNTSRDLMKKIQSEFSGVVHRSDVGTFMVRVGCGLAVYPNVKSPTEMVLSATAALRKAKQAGSGQLVCHDPDKAAEPKPEVKPEPEASRRDLPMVMVVDDEPDISMLVESFLESRGYEVICCNNGDKAIGLMEKIKPQLVLVDMMLFPAASGFELVKAIRARPDFQKIKVVGMTGAYEKSSTQEQVLSIGADAFVGKPLNLGFLADLVKNLLNS